MAKDYGEYFNVAHIEPESHIYGPGKRFVIWLQGCSLACEGCWNQDMWSAREKKLVHRQQLLEEIHRTPDIDGVTLLGGEPLQQRNNTLWLLTHLHAQALTTILYTGYELDELATMGLLDHINRVTDLVIYGRYQRENRQINLQWSGSSNQGYHYPPASRIEARPSATTEIEIIISDNGAVRLLGYPDEVIRDIVDQLPVSN